MPLDGNGFSLNVTEFAEPLQKRIATERMRQENLKASQKPSGKRSFWLLRLRRRKGEEKGQV